jgi:hypothetical protein
MAPRVRALREAMRSSTVHVNRDTPAIGWIVVAIQVADEELVDCSERGRACWRKHIGAREQRVQNQPARLVRFKFRSTASSF